MCDAVNSELNTSHYSMSAGASLLTVYLSLLMSDSAVPLNNLFIHVKLYGSKSGGGFVMALIRQAANRP